MVKSSDYLNRFQHQFENVHSNKKTSVAVADIAVLVPVYYFYCRQRDHYCCGTIPRACRAAALEMERTMMSLIDAERYFGIRVESSM